MTVIRYDEWIEWKGGKSGPPEINGLRCDLKFRCGDVHEHDNSYDYWSNWDWEEGCEEYDDIVAYRIPKEKDDEQG